LICNARCRAGCFSGSLSAPPKTAERLSAKSARSASVRTAFGVYGANGFTTSSSEVSLGRWSASSAASKQRLRIDS
jgi:hypothetical protein